LRKSVKFRAEFTSTVRHHSAAKVCAVAIHLDQSVSLLGVDSVIMCAARHWTNDDNNAASAAEPAKTWLAEP